MGLMFIEGSLLARPQCSTKLHRPLRMGQLRPKIFCSMARVPQDAGGRTELKAKPRHLPY